MRRVPTADSLFVRLIGDGSPIPVPLTFPPGASTVRTPEGV